MWWCFEIPIPKPYSPRYTPERTDRLVNLISAKLKKNRHHVNTTRNLTILTPILLQSFLRLVKGLSTYLAAYPVAYFCRCQGCEICCCIYTSITEYHQTTPKTHTSQTKTWDKCYYKWWHNPSSCMRPQQKFLLIISLCLKKRWSGLETWSVFLGE